MAKKVKKEEEVKPIFKNEEADATVENRLKALYRLQKIASEIDKIRIIRGELPLQVQDLEDTIAGLNTRINKLSEQQKEYETEVTGHKNDILTYQESIKKYTDQQGKVKNNREFESLAKEIEFQNLEIQLSEKKIREATRNIEAIKENVEKYALEREEKQKDPEKES